MVLSVQHLAAESTDAWRI